MNPVRAFLTYIVSLCAIFAVISAYVIITNPVQYPFPIGRQFDPSITYKYSSVINKDDPQILFLGDSLIDSNIDHDMISDKMQKRVSSISEHGSGSAMLYLIVKNEIISARHKPETLVIVTRGSLLTLSLRIGVCLPATRFKRPLASRIELRSTAALATSSNN